MSSTVRPLLLLGRFGAPSGTSRMLSSTAVARGEDNKLVTLTTDNSTGIATVTMQRAPVNSFNYEFSKQLSSAVKEAEHVGARAVIVSSGLPKIFSAGMDLMATYKASEDDMRRFWAAFQEVWYSLMTCSIPTASCIAGHAIAGGAIMPTVTDYRVMVDNPKLSIGLNEAKFGMVAPPWLMDSYRACVGHNAAELGAMLGHLYTPKEALQVGMVHKLAPDADAAREECTKMLKKLMANDPWGVAESKKSLRKDLVERFLSSRQADIDYHVKTLTSPEVKKKIGAYLESMKKQR